MCWSLPMSGVFQSTGSPKRGWWTLSMLGIHHTGIPDATTLEAKSLLGLSASLRGLRCFIFLSPCVWFVLVATQFFPPPGPILAACPGSLMRFPYHVLGPASSCSFDSPEYRLSLFGSVSDGSFWFGFSLTDWCALSTFTLVIC